jgi:hypothetical protein
MDRLETHCAPVPIGLELSVRGKQVRRVLCRSSCPSCLHLVPLLSFPTPASTSPEICMCCLCLYKFPTASPSSVSVEGRGNSVTIRWSDAISHTSPLLRYRYTIIHLHFGIEICISTIMCFSVSLSVCLSVCLSERPSIFTLLLRVH